MAQVWEYIKIALMNIKSNKGRSFLTMLGIIIGISSVIMIISIGDGLKGGINDELNACILIIMTFRSMLDEKLSI